MKNENMTNMIPKRKVKLLKDFSNYKGTLLKDEYVTIDEVKNDGMVRILDCFGRPWVIAEEYIKVVQK